MKNKTVSDYQRNCIKSISDYLRNYRIISGYSQEELCKHLNLHRNTVHRAENGENITLLSFLELADTLEIDLKEMFVDL
ncbi:MAG: helix-turn-helix transcriptional regulator [Bacteroidales bacterium]